ncbi:hypothetical protein [Halorussus amylolyticus]|uniref:hypothetical protein n=1 Tax=Halorussus amylolyticus TaxID=1126242 RepID=UPI00104CCD89|nr:hypothetical protein [Halorussus amylolyticus]
MTAGNPYQNFEEHVRTTLSERTGYTVEKRSEVGKSGNTWQVDCVLSNSYGVRKGYVEVKETNRSSNQSTYINHMRRAYAEMGDFRNVDVPKAVVVAEKWDFGGIDWDAMFDSIDCLLLDIEDLSRFEDQV